MATYTFDTTYAQNYGCDEAIVLNNLIHWIRINKANRSEDHFYNGKYCTYNTTESIAKLYPFWSVPKVRRILESLVNQKVLLRFVRSDRNMNRMSWFALADESMLDLPEFISVETPEEKPNTKPKADIKSANNKFQKPRIEEVRDHIKEKGYQIDPEHFWHYYEARGWVLSNGKKMSSWQSSLVTWKKNDFGKNKLGASNSAVSGNSDDLDNIIHSALGKIATDEMILKVMEKVPEKMWWKIDKYLRARYKGYGGISHLESKVKRNQEHLAGIMADIG